MKNTHHQSGCALLSGVSPRPSVIDPPSGTISAAALLVHVGTGAIRHLTVFQASSGRYRLRVSLIADHEDFILVCSEGTLQEWSSLDELAHQIWRACGTTKCVAISLTKPAGSLTTDDATMSELACEVPTDPVARRSSRVLASEQSRHKDPSACVLTNREKECLAWTLAGKTAWEIGMLLSISERTAAQHLGACIVKLGAVNKHQAANKAAHLGWIKSA